MTIENDFFEYDDINIANFFQTPLSDGRSLKTVNGNVTVEFNLTNLKLILSSFIDINNLRYNIHEELIEMYEENRWRAINDHDVVTIASILIHGLNQCVQTSYDCTQTVQIMIENHIKSVYQYDEKRDFLESLPEWDGKDRIPEMVKSVLYAERPDLAERFMRIYLRASIARVFHPGCKFDQMMVLVGDQGDFKSTFIKTLYGEALFSDEKINGDFSTQKVVESIGSAWAWENAELESSNKASNEALKHFIAQNNFKYRKAYGRNIKNLPISWVYWGTSNKSEFLTDTTGNRRFWIIRKCDSCPKINIDWVRKNRLQVWAQALVDFNKYGCKDMFIPEEEYRQYNEDNFMVTSVVDSFIEFELSKAASTITSLIKTYKNKIPFHILRDALKEYIPHNMTDKALAERLIYNGFEKKRTKMGMIYSYKKGEKHFKETFEEEKE